MDSPGQGNPNWPYLGADDLAPLLSFGSRAFAQRFPLNAIGIPGISCGNCTRTVIVPSPFEH